MAEDALADAVDEDHAALALANGHLQHALEVAELEVEHGADGKAAGAVDQLVEVQIDLDHVLFAADGAAVGVLVFRVEIPFEAAALLW